MVLAIMGMLLPPKSNEKINNSNHYMTNSLYKNSTYRVDWNGVNSYTYKLGYGVADTVYNRNRYNYNKYKGKS